MRDDCGELEVTVEECLRVTHGVLMLVADLFDLQALIPDDPDYGISPAAAHVLTRLCRQQAIDVATLLKHLRPEVVNAPAFHRRRRRSTSVTRTVLPRPSSE